MPLALLKPLLQGGWGIPNEAKELKSPEWHTLAEPAHAFIPVIPAIPSSPYSKGEAGKTWSQPSAPQWALAYHKTCR